MAVRTNSPFIFSILFLFFSFNLPLSLSSDTISATQSLSGDQTIVSANGTFELGFYRSDGNLVLLNESQIPIWSTNQKSTTSNSVVAVLGDDEDPSDGLFSFSFDAINKQLVIVRNRSEQYWITGPWNGEIFSGLPAMKKNYPFNFTYVDNENESYFMYQVSDPSMIISFIMDVSGKFKEVMWEESTGQWNMFWSRPGDSCEDFAFCGAFETCNQNMQPSCTCLNGFSPKSAGGCARETALQCGSTSVANQESTDKFYVYSNMRLPMNSLSVNASSSASDCESSCLIKCSCTAYSYDNNGCSIWIGELMNLQQLSSNDGSGRTLHLRLAASKFPKNPKGNKKEIIIGVVAGSIAVVLLGLVLILIWKRQRRFVGKTKAVEGSLVAFGYKDLQIATKNFSQKLGGGEGQVLDWKTRYEIALGMARGFTYLHEKCRDCIIHCDIKPENILLDAEFCPKVADFGLAKLIGREFSRALTSMRGTIGYLAPEWISGVAITAKADVYSYGMLLFELVSRRRNSAQSQDKKFKFFPIWAASVVAEGGDVLLNLLDPRLENNADEEELRRIARVACWCIQDAANHRPTMGQVVQILEGVLEVNLPQVPQLFQACTDSSSEQSSQSPS
ncbi:hypothetical protein Vadar_018944 [Vaccinium darrowii]|uniref:Uncharacterized protein n=1 Tax=Vaccinium darrowii TaxID=229202 RepID=A0ACB7XS99_9ERIC|nr:hypothetical protein Vadar_018944 [Vaccinium darrowii]